VGDVGNTMDQSSPTNRKLIAGMALAGLISGVLSLISLELLSGLPGFGKLPPGLYAPGTVFGAVVAACCVILLRIRSWPRLLLLIAASTGAYFMAVGLSLYALIGFRPGGWSGNRRFTPQSSWVAWWGRSSF
jgi:hypothetical protein